MNTFRCKSTLCDDNRRKEENSQQQNLPFMEWMVLNHWPMGDVVVILNWNLRTNDSNVISEYFLSIAVEIMLGKTFDDKSPLVQAIWWLL